MAAVVPFLSVISTVATVAGALMSAKGSSEQASASSNVANYNAAVATRDAAAARDQAARDADLQRRQAAKQIGAARAAYGASGVTLEGTPLDVLEESAANAKIDELNVLYKGEMRAMGFDSTAALDTYRGQTALREGEYRSASSLLTGAGTLASSLGKSGAKRTSQSGYQLNDYSNNFDYGQ